MKEKYYMNEMEEERVDELQDRICAKVRTIRCTALLEKVGSSTVVDHERLPNYEQVVRVLWSDGTEVYVNYGDTDVQVDGLTVAATDFAVKEVAQ